MRWPFRPRKPAAPALDSPPAGRPSRAPRAPARREWRSLPPAPTAVDRNAPATIGATTSTIGSPLGLRLPADVSDDALVGLVDGLLLPREDDGDRFDAWPDPDEHPSSELPGFAPRRVSLVDAGSQPGSLTTSGSVRVDGDGSSTALIARHDDGSGADVSARSALAQSRRLGLGPGYHGELADAIRRERLEREHPERDDGGLSEPVPDEVRTAMRDALGVDIGDRAVHRGPSVTDEANRIGALAFTRDGEVYVPIDAGPLDEPAGKGLLAHELTHAAQQARRRAPLPAEGSPESDALEAEARRAERFVRGDAGAPKPGPVNGDDAATLRDTERFVNELVHRGVAERDGYGGVRFNWPRGASATTQRATAPATPDAGAATHEENWSGGARFLHSIGETFLGEVEDTVTSEFWFVPDVERDLRAEREDREREFRRAQTKEAFSQLRLEHLKVEKRRELEHDMTEAEEREIEKTVEAEVLRRTDALEFRVKTHLDIVNEALVKAGHNRQDRLDPDQYDKIFNKLFGQPDGDLPDDDPPDSVNDHAAKVVADTKAKAPAPGTPPTGAPATGAPPAGGHPAAPAPAGGPATPPVTTAGPPGAGDTGDGGIASWRDFKGALATDIGVLTAGGVGITLTDNELKELATGRAEPLAAPAASPAPATPAAHPASGPAPAPAQAAHTGPTGKEMIDLDRIDLEALTKLIYPRVRSTLRQELLVDRERAGRLHT